MPRSGVTEALPVHRRPDANAMPEQVRRPVRPAAAGHVPGWYFPHD